MKYLYAYFFLFIASNSTAEEYQFTKMYFLKDITEVSKTSAFYPVYQFMLAFKNKEPWKALEYCTEESVYSKEFSIENFYYFFKKKYIEVEYTNSDREKYSLHKENGYILVILGITYEKVFFKVKKIDNKYTIFHME